MPEAFIPDPNSPEAEAQRRAGLQTQIDSLKQRTIATQVLGYASTPVAQIGIGVGGTLLTSLLVTVVVGTRRLIRVTGLCTLQKQATTDLVIFDAHDVGSGLAVGNGRWYQTVATSAYATGFFITFDIAPTAGSHTYQLFANVVSGTVDANPVNLFGSYIIVEDAGLAPA